MKLKGEKTRNKEMQSLKLGLSLYLYALMSKFEGKGAMVVGC